MADLKLVGAVAIKVRPNVKGFKAEAEREMKQQLRDLEAEVKVKVKVDAETGEAEAEINKIEKEAKKKVVTLKVGLDHDSVVAAQKRFEALIKANDAISLSFDMKDPADIERMRQELADLHDMAQVEMEYHDDAKGYQAVLDKIAAIRREKLVLPLEFETDEETLAEVERDFKAKLAAAAGDGIEAGAKSAANKIRLNITNDRTSLQKAIDQLKSELAKATGVKVDVSTDPESIKAALADLQKRFDKTPIKVKYEKNAAGLADLLERIDDEIHRLENPEIEIDLALDATGLRRQALKYREELAALNRDETIRVELNRQAANKTKEDYERLVQDLTGKQVELGVNLGATELAAARLAFLGRDRVVNFYVNVSERSMAVAEGAIKSLAGLNVLGDYTSMLERMFTTFDQMAVKAANVALVAGNIVNLLLQGTASAFSIGSGVTKSLGVLAAAPAILGAATVGYTIFTAAFNNFFDAFNKDPIIAKSALAALPPLARKTVDSITGLYKGLANPIQEKFWENVGTTLSDSIETLYPKLKESLLNSTDAVGDFVAGIGKSMNKLALSDDFDKMFAGFDGFFRNLSGASEPFFDAWNKFGVAGASLLPQFGTWLTNLAIQFDTWATKMSANGGIERMIMDGVDALSALWRVGVDVIDIFGAISTAASRAGVGGLGEFEQGLRKIADRMNSEPWQSKAASIFEGARKGTDGLMDGFRNLGTAIGDSAEEVSYILELLGQIGGAVITNLGSLIDSQGFQTGITVGLEGMLKMMRDIQPAAKSLGDIIGNLATIAGSVFSTMGPTVARFFGTVEDVMDKLVVNLAGVAPKLSNTISAVFGAVTPVILILADVLNNILSIINKIPDSFVVAGVAVTAFFALRALASKFYESLVGTSHFKQLEQNWTNSQLAAGKYSTSLQLVDGEMRKVTTLHNQFNPTKAVFNDLTSSVGGTVVGIRDMYRIASSAEVGMSPLMATWKTATTVGGNFFKAIGSGLMGALGGPWGIAIAGAAIGIGAFAQGQADAQAKTEALTASLDKQTGAITAASNAMIADNIMKQRNDGFYLFENGAKSASETIEALGMKVKDTADIVAAGGQPYEDMIKLLQEGQIAADESGIQFDTQGNIIAGNSKKWEEWTSKLKIGKDAVNGLDLIGLIGLLQSERGALDGSQSAWDIRNATLSTADQRVEDFNTAMRTYNDQTLTADQRTRGLKDALDLLSGKELSLGDAEQKVNDSLRNMGGSMQSFSENGVTVMKKVGGAFRDAQGNVKDFNGVIDSTSGKISTVGEAGSVLDTMLQTTTDNTLAMVTKMQDAKKPVSEITQYLADQRQAFVDLGVEAGLDAGLVGKAYDYMIGANPKDLVTTITAQGVEEAKTRVESYKGTLDEIDAYKAVAEIAGDDVILGEKLANSYTDLEAFNGTVATATANLDPTQADAVRERILSDLVILANTNPTVAANMDPALLNEALRIAKGDLDVLHKMRPTPEVRAEISDAEFNILRIQGLISGLTGKDLLINVTYKTQVVGDAPVHGGDQQLQNPFYQANGGILNGNVQTFANGGITGRMLKAFAGGGIENHVAQIQRAGGPVRIWAEPETKAEAYIPYSQAKRPRSLAILSQVAKDFGYTLSKATDSYANGGLAGHATGPTTTNTASVTIGTLVTTDADAAVRKIRTSQQDALAVAGITLNGA